MNELKANNQNCNTKRKNPKIIKRVNARKRLLQTLYQWQISASTAQAAKENFLDYSETRAQNFDQDYFESAYSYITANTNKIDAIISKYSNRVPSSLDLIEHIVLWIGLFEIQMRPDIHNSIAINEAIELVKIYGGTDSSYRFINEILDRAAKDAANFALGEEL